MNSRSAFLSLLIITSCSTTPSVWETVGGAKVSKELLIAAKEACDYDKKHADITVHERAYSRLFGFTGSSSISGQLSDEMEFKVIDLNNTISKLESELSECMRQQDLVQRTSTSNT